MSVLPPSIEAIYVEYFGTSYARDTLHDAVHAVAAEACRLQRDADISKMPNGFWRDHVIQTPFVVKPPK